MNVRPKILPAVCCIALLSACASNQQAAIAPLTIVPMVAKNSSDNPKSMYQMGRYYQGQNRYEQAISAYQKALAADGGFVEARNGLGVIYSRQGKYREAIEAFKMAIEQAPKAAHLYNNMGYAYYLQGQYAVSVTALEQAALLDPTNQRALNNLGLAYAKAGNGGGAVQAFAQAAGMPSAVRNETVTVAEIPSQSALPLPVDGAVAMAAGLAEANVKSARQPEVQVLSLHKDRGVVKSSSGATPVSAVESHVQLVQLAPNVSELRVRQYGDVKPMQMAISTDNLDNLERSSIEVANGNGIAGMAGKVGQFLRGQGYPVARLTNHKPFLVRMTQIQYRNGYQAEAQLLQSSLPDAPALVQHDDLRADVSIRLVLGKDIVPQLAHFDGKWHGYQLARRLNASDS